VEILAGIRHLLHNSAFLIARIVRYFHNPALLDIQGDYVIYKLFNKCQTTVLYRNMLYNIMIYMISVYIYV
jgi:hypothetical protein